MSFEGYIQHNIEGYTYFEDEDTGECIPGCTIVAPSGTKHITPRELDAAKRKREGLERLKWVQHIRSGLGPFSFMYAKGDSRLLNGLSPATITKLVYLSTFLRYEEQNLYHPKHKKQKLRKKDLPEVLGVSPSTAERFVRESKPYLYCDDSGGLCLDGNEFIYGKIVEKQSADFTRIYRTVRALYEGCKPSQHKLLGYVFKTLPYINIEHNVLCWNPTEIDPYKVNPMTALEFCDLVGYSRDHLDRMIRSYNRITFNGEPFCIFYGDGRNGLNRAEDMVLVNPRIAYKGKKHDTSNLFIIAKNKPRKTEGDAPLLAIFDGSGENGLTS